MASHGSSAGASGAGPFRLMVRDWSGNVGGAAAASGGGGGGGDDQRVLVLLPPVAAAGRRAQAEGDDEHDASAQAVLFQGASVLFLPTPESFARDASLRLLANAYGILGVLPLRKELFVGVVTAATSVGIIDEHVVYRITGVRFYSLVSGVCDSGSHLEYLDPVTQQTLPHPCADVHKYLASGAFYFSYTLDLTSSTQRRSLAARPQPSPWRTVNERFLFNRYLLKDLLHIAPPPTGRLPPPLLLCIQGFVEIRRGLLRSASGGSSGSGGSGGGGGDKYMAALISRLSSHRVGTRFNIRGINDGGHVANFVETEQIGSVGGLTHALVLVRGSVPLFWEQKGLQLGGHRVDLARTVAGSLPAVRRHFADLHMAYGAVRVVNLLAQKGGEQTLSDDYRRALNMIEDNLVRVTNFDSHYHLKENLDNIAMLVAELGRDIKTFQFFLRSDSTHETLLRQEGVFRVNCVDCLDRTNMAQGAIARRALDMQLGGAADGSQGVRGLDIFSACLNEMWANNGDALSVLYAGTGALKSGFTRTGKRTMVGMLDDAVKTVNRMYVNTFLDDSRQYVIDLLVGKLSKWQAITTLLRHPLQDDAEASVAARVEAHCQSVQNIRVHVGTWNVNGQPPNGEPLQPWLLFDHDVPDLYAIGFQELVPLSAKQLMNTDPSKLLYWQALIERTLNMSRRADKQVHEYVLLRSEQLVGACMCIFVHKRLVGRITNLEAAQCKTGLAGIAGNKGGVAIRFEVGETSVCFVCAHLAAGQGNVDDRNRDYHTITEGIQFPMAGAIDKHDVIFWFGDFNYRIDVNNEDVRRRCAQGDVKALLPYDQLNQARSKGLAFNGFHEGELTFLPTYKYDVGTNNYDTGEKNRTPAWTDRILYQGRVKRRFYERAELKSSDHKPVKGLYDFEAVVIDGACRETVEEALYSELPGVHVPSVLRRELEQEHERRSKLELFPVAILGRATAPLGMPAVPKRPQSMVGPDAAGPSSLEPPRLPARRPPPPVPPPLPSRKRTESAAMSMPAAVAVLAQQQQQQQQQQPAAAVVGDLLDLSTPAEDGHVDGFEDGTTLERGLSPGPAWWVEQPLDATVGELVDADDLAAASLAERLERPGAFILDGDDNPFGSTRSSLSAASSMRPPSLYWEDDAPPVFGAVAAATKSTNPFYDDSAISAEPAPSGGMHRTSEPSGPQSLLDYNPFLDDAPARLGGGGIGGGDAPSSAPMWPPSLDDVFAAATSAGPASQVTGSLLD